MEKGSNFRATPYNTFRQQGGSSIRHKTSGTQSLGTYNVLNRLEFPHFDGENARGWVRSCSRYFHLIPIPEDHRVSMASIYMQGRFEALDYAKVTTAFNKLHHETTVDAYLESGLKDGVNSFVSTCEPTSLNQAINLARKQEQTVNAILKRAHHPTRNLQAKPPFKPPNRNPSPRPPKQPAKFLTEAEVRAMREKNLCYRCDEPYVPGHKCKYKQVYMLLEDEGTRDCEEDEQGKQINEAETEKEEDISVSLHAMKGNFNCRTLRVEGRVGDKEILFLIDSGSTHCFLDEKVADLLGCILEKTHLMMVRVADGSKLTSQLTCPKFNWKIQGHKFTHSVKLLKLGGYDLVLGCDWLGLYNPIEFNFHQGRITLSQGPNKVILKALPCKQGRRTLSTNTLSHLMRGRNPDIQGELLLSRNTSTEVAEHVKVQEVLQMYEDVVKEPHSLPLEREIEHRIEFLPEAIPRKQHPYRYAYGQKTEIERIVKELLDSGIIRHSQSSFASPV
ncbi:UNVERIFIED_CONTAM: hypothetical protein Sindi_0061600 [Sesamum indicum]